MFERLIRGLFVALTTLLPVALYAAGGTMKGNGSAEKPFQIEDYGDLKAIGKGAYLYSSNYVLTKDIDASASWNEMCNEDGCNGFIPIGKNKDAADSVVFWGTIDGQNHTISNLKIWLPCEDDVGFIYALIGTVKNLNFDHLHVTGRIDESLHVGGVVARLVGTVENVHVTNGFVQGRKRVGGIAGCAMRAFGYSDIKAVLKNVSFQGDIKGEARIGGIVGETDEASVDGADADVNIIVMDERAGGIVGYSDGSISNSRSSGTIVPGDTEVDEVGGIAGKAEEGILWCVSTMDLMHSGSYFFDEDIGGIVGAGISVTLSYALGTVEGKEYVGGIAGSGLVANSFAMGTVRGGHHVGGLVGYGSVTASYAANAVQGDSLVGGLVGKLDGSVESSYWNTEVSGLDSSDGGTGLTTAQMMTLSSFAGWDTLGYKAYEIVQMNPCDGYELDSGWCYRETDEIIRIWGIDEGKSFPYLAQNPFSKKSLIPIALPTAASKWQEKPKVAALVEGDGELVGEWLGWAKLNERKENAYFGDSIYYGYRIGIVNGTDTVWGTSSHMAVPNKIEISSIEELQKIGNDVAYPLIASYELTKDIDASGFAFKPIGDSVHVFSGMFDGKNHTISNLEINEPNGDFVGMFSFTDVSVIQNVTFKNAKVTASWYAGVLAGEIDKSLVTNVVSLNGEVSGTSFIGGLMGATRSTELNKVATTGSVKANDIVGGIIGASASIIKDAFSVNVVKGYENVGGVIGLSDEFSSATLQRNIYSASLIKSPEPRGIIGGSFFGSGENMEHCYFDSTVTGNVRGGNTTEEMLKQATYEGFNFDTLWAIQEGVSYPYFQGMEPILPGTLEDDGTVNMLAGFGTAVNPYKIGTYDELKYVGKFEYGLDKYYKLVGNIKASESARENCNADSSLCKGFEPIGEFSGVFMGNNKIIAGLNINRPDEDSVGLFRSLASGAVVTGIVFDTTSYFTESYSYDSDKTKGKIRGKNYVGALAGVDKGAVVENIFVKYDVRGTDYVGGVAGKKNAGSIVRSASKDTIVGEEYVGGLFGSLGQATVKDCFGASPVIGSLRIGGLTGSSSNATVQNSYAVGNVLGTSKFGGVVGEDVGSAYTAVYYDTTIWYQTKTTAAGELRNTDQMVQKENYEGWDFEKTWRIAADTTYPYFTWMCTNSYLSKTMDERIRPNRYVDVTMMHMEGSGTKDDPFLVKTYGDLKSIGFGKYKLSAVYQLANDIDASASADEVLMWNAEKGFKPIGEMAYFGRHYGDYGIQDTSEFSGKFYGNGFSIDNLTICYKKYQPSGFIDTLAPSGLIENLTFKNLTYSKAETVGLVGTNYGVIKNVHVEATYDSVPEAAGFASYNRGSVENCTIKAQIIGGYPFAGVAYANDGKITKVKAEVSGTTGDFAGIALVNGGLIDKATVTANVVSKYGTMAGIAGLNRSTGSIGTSSATVNMTSTDGGTGHAYYYEALYQIVSLYIDGIGGIVGVDSGSVTGSTASGVIVAPNSINVGGLVGAAYGKKLDSLHAKVDVTGYNFVGGFVGRNGTRISNSYAMGNAEGQHSVGGFVGEVDSAGVIERSFATGSMFVEGGGFVGSNFGTVRQSYATGDINGRAGTFVYRNYALIEDCYSTGNAYVEQDRGYASGFAGQKWAGNIRGYSVGATIDGETRLCSGMDGRYDSLDIVYYLADNCIDSLSKGVGLTYSKMHQQKSFSGFDFDSVWYIKEGVSYPMLRGMPNVPVAGKVELTFGEGKFQAKSVRSSILNGAFVMDSSYKVVVRLDSASEALLDSLDSEGEKAEGEFTVRYRVGMLFDGDTVWGSPTQATFSVEGTTVVAAPAFDGQFSAMLKGNTVALHFGLESAGMTKFSLFDMQGRMVRMFNLGQRSAGAYSEALDAGAIARGRYVGVLQVNGRIAGKTLMLKR